MQDADQLPLRPILERKTGTLRFGHALRLLKLSSASQAREVIDELEHVQTRDQLVRVLCQLTEACALLAAKTEYVIVPSDEDLIQLSEDVTQYSASTIAGLLMLLASLRYPRSEESPQRAVSTLWRLLLAVLQGAVQAANQSSVSSIPSFSHEPFQEGEDQHDSSTNDDL